MRRYLQPLLLIATAVAIIVIVSVTAWAVTHNSERIDESFATSEQVCRQFEGFKKDIRGTLYRAIENTKKINIPGFDQAEKKRSIMRTREEIKVYGATRCPPESKQDFRERLKQNGP